MSKIVVMISGANRGIGLAIAKKLYQDTNYCLSFGVRDKSSIDLQNDFPDSERVHVSLYDALKPGTTATWLNQTIDKFSKLDALINNAGIIHSCGIDNYSEKVLDEMWQVNTKAPIMLTKLAWEYLKQSGRARVINIVSIAAKTTRPNEFGYNLTKHALLAFTHSIRQAGWDFGIRAHAICPGWVNTDMAASATICDLKQDDMVQPEDIATVTKMLIELPNPASIAEVVINPECGTLF